MVADYRFTYIKSANGDVKELVIETILKAVGGLKKGSLLFNLGLDQALVESVTGNRLEYDFIKVNENGTEAGLTEAVIPIFDNSRSVLVPPAGFSVTNVFNDQPTHGDSVTLAELTKQVKEPIDVLMTSSMTNLPAFLALNNPRFAHTPKIMGAKIRR